MTTRNLVGIGTTDPQYTLDVVGDINVTGDLFTNGQNASGALYWSETPTENIFASTNVGIGTTNPVESLHIHNGRLRIDSLNNDSGTVNVIDNNSFGLYIHGNGGSSAIQGKSLINFHHFAISAINSNTPGIPLEDATPTGQIGFIENSLSAGWLGSFIVRTKETSAKDAPLFERMRVTSAGNVGIGVTNPNSLFQVNSNVGSLYVNNNNLSNNGVTIFGPARTAPSLAGTSDLYGTLFVNSIDPYEGNRGASIALGGRGNDFGSGQQHQTWVRISGVQQPGSTGFGGDLVMETNASGQLIERMRIAANGNVGIGLTNPAEKLHVMGNIRLGVNANQYHHIRMGGGNSHGYLFGSFPALGDGINLSYNHYFDSDGNIQYVNTGSGASNASLSVGYGQIIMRTGSNDIPPTTRMRIDNVGNVGIGTFIPEYRLDIRSEENTVDEIVRIRSRRFAGLRIEGDSANLSGEPGGAFIRLSQDSQLTVASIGLTQAAGQDGLGDTATGTFNNALFIQHASDDVSSVIQFGTRKQARMTIISGGNVGIGTSNPVSRFQVFTPSVSGTSPTTRTAFGSSAANQMDVTNATSSSEIVLDNHINATLISDSAITYTQASTVRINGPPIAGTNVTFTNAAALYVREGNIRHNNAVWEAPSGSAPLYSARAWATYNGNANALLDSGNIASYEKLATGSYRFNFTTAMPSTNYSVTASFIAESTTGAWGLGRIRSITTTSFILEALNASTVLHDVSRLSFAVFI